MPSATGRAEEDEAVISTRLLEAVRCPACADRPSLREAGDRLTCPRGHTYPVGPGYLDLLPPVEGRISDYVAHEEEFAHHLAYERVNPPLLSAGVRQRVLERLLNPGPADRVLDLGCGNGKFAWWTRGRVDWIVGLDPATLFAREVREGIDLVRGDGRALPFAEASFTALYSIDVLEHLTLPDLRRTLTESGRVLTSRGRLFLFSNTREPSRLEPLVNASRRLSLWLAARGWIDRRRDELRKADHVKALETYEDLEREVTAAGFQVLEVWFWNAVITAFVENVLSKLLEAWVLNRRRGTPSGRTFPPEVPQSPSERPSGGNVRRRGGEIRKSGSPSPRPEGARAARGLTYWGARLLTEAMALDLVLWRRLRAGPYFLLAERRP